MTQPQPEYIITEEQLARIQKATGLSSNSTTLISIRSRPHTPAAQAAEYTIEQIAEIDNRIRKERKAEREHVLDELILMIKRKEGCGYIFMDGPRFFTMIESLRGGAP